MPFELKKKDTYIHIRFLGILESRDLKILFPELRKLENNNQFIFNKITTLSDITDFVLQFSAMLPAVQDRGLEEFKKSFKSAIVASRPIERAAAGMLQNLNMNPNIIIKIFPNLTEAEEWVNE